MVNVVLDASAILAYLGDEPGSDLVETAMAEGAVIGAANWSEVAQKVRSRGGDWLETRALLLSYDIHLEPVTEVDAERAAALWKRDSGLSLADRLCLAVSARLSLEVLTADGEWMSSDMIQVRQIR